MDGDLRGNRHAEALMQTQNETRFQVSKVDRWLGLTELDAARAKECTDDLSCKIRTSNGPDQLSNTCAARHPQHKESGQGRQRPFGCATEEPEGNNPSLIDTRHNALGVRSADTSATMSNKPLPFTEKPNALPPPIKNNKCLT